MYRRWEKNKERGRFYKWPACSWALFCYNKWPKMIAFKSRLKEAVFERLKAVYPVTASDLDMAPTPDPKMGDLALTFPFTLAKTLRKAPRRSPRRPLPCSPRSKGSSRPRSRGPASSTSCSTRPPFSPRPSARPDATSLRAEERQGHRRAHQHQPQQGRPHRPPAQRLLGDTLVRCLRFKGETVEVQNYIDDTGVQVADVVVGFMELREEDPRGPREPSPGRVRLLLLGPLRPGVRLSRRASRSPGPEGRRSCRPSSTAETPECDHGPRHVSRRIVRAHLATMRRIGIALRPPALRERHPRASSSGTRPSPCSRRGRPSTSRPRARTRAAG